MIFSGEDTERGANLCNGTGWVDPERLIIVWLGSVQGRSLATKIRPAKVRMRFA
jgi:hypothetical protein